MQFLNLILYMDYRVFGEIQEKMKESLRKYESDMKKKEEKLNEFEESM